ncbi:MAG TPA: endo-1,4-beta-xylanase [Pilimelia sp.]|nr:endo-1,4-beta-xylanase [Pilimelia sp.]
MRAKHWRRTKWTPIGVAALLAASAAVALPPLLLTPAAQAADPVVVLSHGFEDGTTQGWGGRSAETVATSTAAARTGSRSLLVSGRTASWQGPARSLLGSVEKGTRYTLSAWVRLAAGEPAAQARLSVERRTAGTPSYDQATGNVNVTATGWTQLTGSYTLAHDVDFLTAYVETVSGTSAIHIDDFTMSYVPATPIQTNIPAVKAVLAPYFPIGTAISPTTIIGQHAQLLNRHFSSVTPGNSLKWDATEPAAGSFRFTDADAAVNFAVANGLEIRGHTLIWHQQTPSWVFADAAGNPMTATAANKALLLSRIESHVSTVVGRYRGKIKYWDVANEVIDENQADGLRRSRWFEIAGLDFLRTAFRAARAADPAARLFINDYNTNVPAKRDKLFNLVSALRAEGVPIDGVGHQMHVNIDWPSVAETEAMITKFVPLGVDQQVTEMDISIYTNTGESFPTPPRDRLIKQGYRYRDLMGVFKRHADAISSVTLWGLADDDTWLDSFPVARKDAPLLFDTELQAKPAYWGIVDPSRIEGAASASPTASAAPTASASPTGNTSPTAGASPGPTNTGQAPPPCQVRYTVTGQWQGGFQGEVRVTALAPVNGWTLRWTFPNGQRLDQLWNGTATQTGAAVAVTNASWNRSIPANSTATVGFLASWAGTNGPAADITLNNAACQRLP